MKRYPLPINSGQEARLLEYVGKNSILTNYMYVYMYIYIYMFVLFHFLIGDKVAKMLDKKISEFLDNGG